MDEGRCFDASSSIVECASSVAVRMTLGINEYCRSSSGGWAIRRPDDACGTATPGSMSDSDQKAAFTAAGFALRDGQWLSECGLETGTAPDLPPYTPGTIDTVTDINRDGGLDVVLVDGGLGCYGNTATGFWLLTKRHDRWTLLTSSRGIPRFLESRGRDGWPDIEVGEPGFCFRIVRWDGTEYRTDRYEYEGKVCKPW